MGEPASGERTRRMKRSALLRKTPLRRGKPLRKAGKRVNAWKAMVRKLKPAFFEALIVTCEIKLLGCWGAHGLGFAHSLKRRNIPPGSPLLAEVVLGCNHCHGIIELLPENEMATVVRGIIATREVQIVL